MVRGLVGLTIPDGLDEICQFSALPVWRARRCHPAYCSFVHGAQCNRNTMAIVTLASCADNFPFPNSDSLVTAPLQLSVWLLTNLQFVCDVR